eukprot:456973-Rhodomonas_salina.2
MGLRLERGGFEREGFKLGPRNQGSRCPRLTLLGFGFQLECKGRDPTDEGRRMRRRENRGMRMWVGGRSTRKPKVSIGQRPSGWQADTVGCDDVRDQRDELLIDLGAPCSMSVLDLAARARRQSAQLTGPACLQSPLIACFTAALLNSFACTGKAREGIRASFPTAARDPSYKYPGSVTHHSYIGALAWNENTGLQKMNQWDVPDLFVSLNFAHPLHTPPSQPGGSRNDSSVLQGVTQRYKTAFLSTPLRGMGDRGVVAWDRGEFACSMAWEQIPKRFC